MTRATFFRRLRRDQRGNAIVEFALTAPLFLIVVFGILDFSWQYYAKTALQGVVNDAARAATLEGNALSQTALDNEVRRKVLNVFPQGTVTFSRSLHRRQQQWELR